MKKYLLLCALLLSLNCLNATYYTKNNYEAYLSMGIGGSNSNPIISEVIVAPANKLDKPDPLVQQELLENKEETLPQTNGSTENTDAETPPPPRLAPNLNAEPTPTMDLYNPGGAYPQRGLYNESRLHLELKKESYNPGGAYPHAGLNLPVESADDVD